MTTMGISSPSEAATGNNIYLKQLISQTGALMIKAKEAIPAGYRYKINVVFVEV